MMELRSQHLFDITMRLRTAVALGDCPAGERRVVTIADGEFSGERLRGVVLGDGASDLLVRRADGSLQQDVRLLLRTDDRALILMTYRGIRHSSPDVAARLARGEVVVPYEYYLRTAPFFETSAPRYAWLNCIVAVAVGAREPSAVRYHVFEVQ